MCYLIILRATKGNRRKNMKKEDEPLFELSVYGMELYPDYFSSYPAPIITPSGRITRSLTLTNGVYWLATNQCATFLAICYPIWEGDLSDGIKELGKQTPYDKREPSMR